MASGASVRSKVSSALSRMNASSRVVKLRTVTVVAGTASRLGIQTSPANRTVVDTLVTPQPAVEAVSSEDIATSGGLYQPGDYKFTFAGTIAESALRNALILYGDDVLQVHQMIPSVLGGVVVAWEVVARSIQSGD